MVSRFLVFVFAVCFAQPLCAADWVRGESDNYIVIAELDEAEMRSLLQTMEDFHRLIRRQLPPQTPSGRKLTLYLHTDADQLNWVDQTKVRGAQKPNVAAVYTVYKPTEEPIYRFSGVFFYQTLYHLDHRFTRVSPFWVRAGLPAFFATTYVNEEGDFILGAPDIRRALERNMNQQSVERVTSTEYLPRNDLRYYRFWTESRELIRPLLVDPRTSGLLNAYLTAYDSGASLEEARGALGDLEVLFDYVQELQRTRRPTMRRVTLSPEPISEPSITVLSDAEEKLFAFPVARAVEADVKEVSEKALKILEAYPDSALAWHEYAAAEFERVRASQFGDEQVFRGFGFSNGEIVVAATLYSDTEAWRAVNRALELRPDYPHAQVLKAEILLARLVRSTNEDETQGFETVRAMLAPYLDNPAMNPMAAALNYQSYLEQDAEPPQAALEALGQAFVANAGVSAFRYAYASALVRLGFRDEAENLLSSMLNNPEYRDAARRALDQMNP